MPSAPAPSCPASTPPPRPSGLLALEEGLQRQWLDDPEGIPLAAYLETAVSGLLTVPLWDEDPAAVSGGAAS